MDGNGMDGNGMNEYDMIFCRQNATKIWNQIKPRPHYHLFKLDLFFRLLVSAWSLFGGVPKCLHRESDSKHILHRTPIKIFGSGYTNSKYLSNTNYPVHLSIFLQ